MASRIEQLLELLKPDPDDSFLNYALALEFAKLGEREKAVTIINAILKRDENYLGAYYQLGQLLEQAQEPLKAKNIYEKGILIARKQKNVKTAGELLSALEQLDLD